VNTPRTFSITTLGCKVNQSESEAIARGLEDAGLAAARREEAADLCIVNTCTVTGKASMQSRRSIRQAVRRNPDARVIVTGCYAQTAPEEIRRIAGVEAVIEQRRKHCVVDTALRRPCAAPATDNAHSEPLAASPVLQPGRGRPFLKIQDGCESFCTYCIVPYARGPSRSLPVEAVLRSLRQIRDDGHAEAVLIEPGELCGRILRQTAGVNGAVRICPHFHIPLQSGDAEILRRMGRPYSPRFFADRLEEIRATLPTAAIGTDVLVGFPGESESAFQNTLQVIEAAPLTYLHVFPFSPRKGTPAYGFSGRPAAAVVKDRCRQLRDVGMRKKIEFYQRFVNKTLEVVLETKVSGDLWLGTSENYIPVRVQVRNGRQGQAVAAAAVSVEPDLILSGSVKSGPES